MKRFCSLVLAFLVISLNSACGVTRSGELTVYKPWIRPALAGQNGAVYFVIENQKKDDDSLIGVQVSNQIAEGAEMHLSWVTKEDFVQMRLQESILLQSGTQVVFSPGGLHVMLISLQQDLVDGDSVELSLLFERSGDIIIMVPVGELTKD